MAIMTLCCVAESEIKCLRPNFCGRCCEELFEEVVLTSISKNLISEITSHIYFMKKMNGFASILESVCVPIKSGILINQAQNSGTEVFYANSGSSSSTCASRTEMKIDIHLCSSGDLLRAKCSVWEQ